VRPGLAGDPVPPPLHHQVHGAPLTPAGLQPARMGSRLADLVFAPTLACRGVRRPEDGLAPSPDRSRGRTYI
jgi:hypothetical protein